MVPFKLMGVASILNNRTREKNEISIQQSYVFKNGEITIFNGRFHHIQNELKRNRQSKSFIVFEFPSIRDEILALAAEYENCK